VRRPPAPPGLRGFIFGLIVVWVLLIVVGWLIQFFQGGTVPTTAAVLALGIVALVYMAYRRWSGYL
jgi:hypothetical protein